MNRPGPRPPALSDESRTWRLELGGEWIATLLDEGITDFPWTDARLIDSPKFERFRVYFSDEKHWPDGPEIEALCAEVHARGHFVLRHLATNAVYQNVTLNHDQAQVWFRCS